MRGKGEGEGWKENSFPKFPSQSQKLQAMICKQAVHSYKFKGYRTDRTNGSYKEVVM